MNPHRPSLTRLALATLVATMPWLTPSQPATAAPARDTKDEPVQTIQTAPVNAKVRPLQFPLRAGQTSTVPVRIKAPGTPSSVQKGAPPPQGTTIDSAPTLPPASTNPPPSADDTPPIVGGPPRLAAARLGIGFEGMSKSDNPVDIDPPDSQIAAGPQHIVEFMNVTGRVYDKAGLALDTFDLGEFFLTPEQFSVTSPQITYDPPSGRFFALMVAERTAAPAAGLEMLAVSDTSDPTAGWLVYHTETAGIFPDAPALGVGGDKVVINSNAFPTPSGGYLGAQTRVYQKSDLLTGRTVTISSFAPVFEHFSIQPTHSGPDSQGILWMAAIDFQEGNSPVTTLKLFTVTGLPDDDNVGRVMTTLTMPGVTAPPDAVQRQSAQTIRTGDNRLQDAAYRQGALWLASHTGCEFDTTPGAAESCLRIMKVNVTSTSAAISANLALAATYGAPDAFYYYPALTLDAAGNVYVVFGRSSADEFPSLRHTGLQPHEAGLQGSVELRAGESAFTGARWGSHFGAAPDPVGQNCVWVVGEYARTPVADDMWGQYIGQLNFAGQCGSVSNLIEGFESGHADGWLLAGESNGYAEVVREGGCFSANNSLGIRFNGEYALNVRSASVARTNSVGIARSPSFTLGKALAFTGLSEADDAAPMENPVTLEVRIVDTSGTVLSSQVVRTNVVTLSPGTSSDGCRIGEVRTGDFSLHAIDTANFEGQTGSVEFRQHTNRRGKGFFTLIDDVTVVTGATASLQ